MKHLIIIRHAKSSWDFPLEDKKRPLIDSGIQAISKVGISAREFVSEEFTVWSSTAVRAAETAKIFCKESNLNDLKIQFKEELYTFNENQLEKSIKSCDDSIQKLILFGHNEAITNFVNKFGDKNIFNVPTAGLTYLQFETNSWKNIAKGTIVKYIFPKEI